MHIAQAVVWALASSVVSAIKTNSNGHVDLNFQQYAAGDVLSDLGNGVHLRAIKKDKKTKKWITGQPMVFDSAHPTGEDDDLGTPNEEWGGPGIGKAGEAGPVCNTMALGNLIIVSEDEDRYDPDDNVGGLLIFTFDEPMFLDNTVLVDNEEDTEFDVEYTSGGRQKIFLGDGGDNSVETVTFFDKPGFDQPISALNITMHGSGAISFVAIRPASWTQKALDDNTCQSDFVFDASSAFTYKNDLFRSTNNPDHAEGTIKTVGGKDLLEVRLGSVDGTGGKEYDMSGGFETTFTLMEPSTVQITVKAQLSLVSYEVDEYAEVLVSVDGTLVGIGGQENVLRIDGVVAGNGGLESLTLDTIQLDAGDHTLAIGGFNNKKTAKKEVSTIHYESVDIEAIYDCAIPTASPTVPPPTSSPTDTPTRPPPTRSPTVPQKPLDDNTCQSDFVFDASSAFTYKNDLFRGTSNPDHAEGTTRAVGGKDLLEVRLGSVDGTKGKEYDMSGGFETTFTLMEPSTVQITVEAQLSMVSYEVDEYAEVLVSVDGTLVGIGGQDYVLRIDGEVAGNGGLESLTLDTIQLDAGEHTLAIGGFNNKKTAKKEVSTIHYESVDIEAIYDCAIPTASPTGPPPTSSPTDAPTGPPPTSSPTGPPPTSAPTGNPTAAPTKEGDPRKGQKGTLPPSPSPTPGLAADIAPVNGTLAPGNNTGIGGGDPHFKTWTGVKFDYHGECDLVLVHNPEFANGMGLHVQIRTTRVKYYSYIERIAVNIGSDVLEFGNDIDNWLLNGKKAGDNASLAGYEVKKFTRAKAVSIRLNNKTKSKIDLFRRKTGMPYIMIDGGHDDSMFKGSLGLIGDFATGKMIGRDGTTEFSDGEKFALEWQVRTNYEPMMFQTARTPQFPQLCIPPKKMLRSRLGDSHMRKKAEEICEAWKEDMEDCVFDVMATRDLSGATEAPVHHTATH